MPQLGKKEFAIKVGPQREHGVKLQTRLWSGDRARQWNDHFPQTREEQIRLWYRGRVWSSLSKFNSIRFFQNVGAKVVQEFVGKLSLLFAIISFNCCTFTQLHSPLESDLLLLKDIFSFTKIFSPSQRYLLLHENFTRQVAINSLLQHVMVLLNACVKQPLEGIYYNNITLISSFICNNRD